MSQIALIAFAHVALHVDRKDFEPRPRDRRVGIVRRMQQHEVRRREISRKRALSLAAFQHVQDARYFARRPEPERS